MSTPTFVPRKIDGFLTEEMDGEVVLFHPARNIIIHTNQTAALVWQLCDGHNSIQEIVRILGGAYPEAFAQIATDVPETIQRLQSQGALDGN